MNKSPFSSEREFFNHLLKSQYDNEEKQQLAKDLLNMKSDQFVPFLKYMAEEDQLLIAFKNKVLWITKNEVTLNKHIIFKFWSKKDLSKLSLKKLDQIMEDLIESCNNLTVIIFKIKL